MIKPTTVAHWMIAGTFFVVSAIAWTVIGHYTTKFLEEKIDK